MANRISSIYSLLACVHMHLWNISFTLVHGINVKQMHKYTISPLCHSNFYKHAHTPFVNNKLVVQCFLHCPEAKPSSEADEKQVIKSGWLCVMQLRSQFSQSTKHNYSGTQTSLDHSSLISERLSWQALGNFKLTALGYTILCTCHPNTWSVNASSPSLFVLHPFYAHQMEAKVGIGCFEKSFIHVGFQLQLWSAAG